MVVLWIEITAILKHSNEFILSFWSAISKTRRTRKTRQNSKRARHRMRRYKAGRELTKARMRDKDNKTRQGGTAELETTRPREATTRR